MESFACRIGRCFWIAQDKSEPIIAIERPMKLLIFLVESFIATFGITRPKPEQQRTVALALGGFLLLCFAAFVSLIAWMLFGVRR